METTKKSTTNKVINEKVTCILDQYQVNNKDPKIKSKDKDSNPTYSFQLPQYRNQTIQQHH